jgi:hypothetical protein
MPQSRQSNTFKLPNGNRVTVTTGAGRRSTYKTVTVKRPNGTSTSRTYRRGGLLAYFLGGYDTSVPGWAAAGQQPQRSAAAQLRALQEARSSVRLPQAARTRTIESQQSETLVDDADRVVSSVLRLERAAKAHGGPETIQATHDLTEAATLLRTAAAAEDLRAYANAAERLAKTARAYERACSVDGLPEWVQPARNMTASFEQSGTRISEAVNNALGQATQAQPELHDEKPIPAETIASCVQPLNLGQSSRSSRSFREEYRILGDLLLASLSNVQSPDAAHTFRLEWNERIRQAAATTPEFYIGEFIDKIKPRVAAKSQTELDDLKRTVDEIQTEAKRVSAELTSRLRAAKATGEAEAEHAIWKEREDMRAELQARIDAMTNLDIKATRLRLDTFRQLMTGLGF